MRGPLVSIITVSYNSEKTIHKSIESVLQQTYDEIEYILVDGQSEDNTVGIAESYRLQFDNKGYGFTIISEPDSGMYDALNKGVKIANGQYIGQINSDDWYEPVAVERAVEYMTKIDADVFWGNLRIVKPTGNLIKYAKISNFMTTRHWNHPTTFIKATVYKENPYALISMYDDFELILRLHKKRCKMVTCDEVLANFSFGGMSTTKDWRETKARIGYRCRNYKRNGYGFIYFIDSAMMETLKFILA